MFIESSAPRRSGDSAVLESPALAKSYRCFTMWYHMYGKNIGKLAVSAKNLFQPDQFVLSTIYYSNLTFRSP